MRKLICGIGIAALCLSAFGQSSTKKVNDLKQKNKSVEKQVKDIQQDLRGVKTERRNLSAEIKRYDNEMNSIAEQLDTTREKLSQQKELQKTIAKDLDVASAQMTEVRNQLSTRVRAMYKQGGEQPMLVLAGARSMSQFASRKAILERIATNDRELFAESEAIKKEVETKKLKQDAVVEEIKVLEQKQAQSLQALQTKRVEKHAIVVELAKDQAQLEMEYAAMEEQSRKLEAQIAKYQGSSSMGPYTGGKFAVPTRGRLSSRFGTRIHPITKRRKMHTGLDIAASSGTAINAAASGRVITAGWVSGYGNTVIIDHGSGLSTLYGHCSRLYVSKGQSVTRGQKIAAVGSTGFSTGPHLHFEVRKNGRPVNPDGYLK